MGREGVDLGPPFKKVGQAKFGRTSMLPDRGY